MKTLKLVLLGLLGTVLLTALGGFFLPSRWHVQREVLVQASPEVLHSFVGDLRRWPEWSEWEQPENEMTLSYEGPAVGPGARQSWTSPKMGNGSLTVTAVDASSVSFDLEQRAGSPASKAVFRFSKEAQGTRVTWTVDGDMGPWPFSHYMVGMIEKLTAEAFEKSLARLKTKAEAQQASFDKVAAEEAQTAAAAAARATVQQGEIERVEATSAAHH